MALLTLAVVLVRWVPLGWWRGTLGTVCSDNGLPPAGSPLDAPLARRLIGRIEQATRRLPFRVKCLPRAVALQWLLRWKGQPGALVVAVHRRDRTSEDAYHAWIEHDGAMLIGHCDASEYQPLMVIETRSDGG